MTVKILYVEEVGAGQDEEHKNPNGIFVRLSKWEADINPFHRLPNHYIVECVVMIDREYVFESTTIHVERWNKDTEWIRAAITIMDEFCEKYPQAAKKVEE